jgi:beta-lactamase class A
VRYDAYSEIHPSVSDLSNMDFIEIHAERRRPLRYAALLERIGVASSEAQAVRIEEAFDRYYSRLLNSGTLEAYGYLLEKIVTGDLLSDEHTRLLLSMMERIDTGDRRIKGGLPQGYPFAHKTGTQVERSCNIGILRPYDEDGIIVAACIENFGALENAEAALQQLGRALAETHLAAGGE